jgi:hypothetical protein
MKSACRSEDRRRAPESNTKNGRDKAQESQNEEFLLACPPEPWRRRMPSALFRGHSVGLNSPDRLIQPIPSPGKPNAGATRPFFASLALCDFAFDSGAKNSSPSHRFAVSRSDVGEGFHLAAPLKANRARKSNLIQLNRTKSNQIAPFLKHFFMQKSIGKRGRFIAPQQRGGGPGRCAGCLAPHFQSKSVKASTESHPTGKSYANALQ